MNLVQIRRYFRDARVPSWRKFVVVGAVAYVLLPLDVVPDLVPLLGWLDDIGALGAALAFFARDVSAHAAKQGAVDATETSELAAGVQVIDAMPLKAMPLKARST